MNVSIVVAAAENNVIGSANALPWRLPDDLRRFKALTLGKPVVMGRRTWESIGKPLPGRTNIVVSRRSDLLLEGATVVDSLAQAFAAGARHSAGAPEVMVIGGAEIYRQALASTTTVHLTRVHARVAGDAYFPELAAEDWAETELQFHPVDERHAYAFSFVTLQRIRR
jgi:dihydrofolate reductase